MNVQSAIPERAQLPTRWQTKRLQITDSILADAPALAALFNACAYVGAWDETFHPVPDAELAELVTNSLATNGEHARFRLQCIRTGDTDQLVGYFHLYHGIPPNPATILITMFVIHPTYHGQRYGQEVAQGLWKQGRELGYPTVWLKVYLKNWPALRFWIGQGFTTIREYRGDPVLTPESYASLIVEKVLRQ
jgi:diamine N-acetyltransferase